jgi:hypothetical protein
VLLEKNKIDALQSQLKSGPWYAHFWKDNEMIVVFRHKSFQIKKNDKLSWAPVIDYGQRQGVPIEQLDFLTS